MLEPTLFSGSSLSHVVLLTSFSTHSDALKIFENCPAADKMKDISLMFPIYNMVGIQLKGGVIDQDDECSLEMDLAERFCHEAQLQAYHYARALANLAESMAVWVCWMKHLSTSIS